MHSRPHFDRVIRVSIPIACRPPTSMRRSGSTQDVSASFVGVRSPPRTYRRAPSKLYFASSNMASQATTVALIGQCSVVYRRSEAWSRVGKEYRVGTERHAREEVVDTALRARLGQPGRLTRHKCHPPAPRPRPRTAPSGTASQSCSLKSRPIVAHPPPPR